MEAKAKSSSGKEIKFSDVSGLAHSAKLYGAVGDLHRSLMAKLKSAGQAEKWLRELIDDALESQLEDSASQDRMHRSIDD